MRKERRRKKMKCDGLSNRGEEGEEKREEINREGVNEKAGKRHFNLDCLGPFCKRTPHTHHAGHI